MAEKIKNRIKTCIGALMMAACCALLFYPDVNNYIYNERIKTLMEKFDIWAAEMNIQDRETDIDTVNRYNETLAAGSRSKQDFLSEYENIPGELQNISALCPEDGIYGYISIEKMNVNLPLYIGAGEDNLAKGACILGNTSIPTDSGETASENCVIAAHRTYSSIAFFRDIEKLGTGDTVMITNVWGKIEYTVTDTQIVLPSDMSVAEIQKGRQLLTLLSCHPTDGSARYRYVVVCEKKVEPSVTDEKRENEVKGNNVYTDGLVNGDTKENQETENNEAGTKYILTDNGKNTEELRNIKYPDIYKIEKVVLRTAQSLLVLGMCMMTALHIRRKICSKNNLKK